MMEVVEKKTKVSFGTTGPREVFPTHVPHTRFGNELIGIRGAPNRGPGCYDNEEVSNLFYGVKTRILSDKGYVLGARTGPRLAREYVFKTPAPTAYQKDHTELIEFDPNYKAFNAAANRFPVYKRDVEEITPGAGTYEHSISRNRKVQWHGAFGGTPINLPDVEQQSTILKNTEKLMSTKEEKKYHRKLAYLKLYYE